jgi:hypothetical protein
MYFLFLSKRKWRSGIISGVGSPFSIFPVASQGEQVPSTLPEQNLLGKVKRIVKSWAVERKMPADPLIAAGR